MEDKLIENMNLEEDVSLLISNLGNIEKEYNKVLDKYSEAFSEQDRKQQDILHYLEFNNLNSVATYRLMKELKEVRLERRKAEDIINLLNNLALRLKFNSKTTNANDIVEKRKKQLDNRKYQMRYYTEKQLKDIANLPIYKGGEENV